MHPEVIEHRPESGQRLNRVDLAAFDAFDHLLQRNNMDHGVRGVEFLRVHADRIALEQEDVLHLRDLGFDVDAILFWLGGIETRINVANNISNHLVNETLLTDLVEVRKKLNESAESDCAERRVARTDGTGGVGRIVVDGLHGFRWNTALFDATMELGNERVGLRAVANPFDHLTKEPIPRCVEQIDVRGCPARRFLHAGLGVEAVAVCLATGTNGKLAAALGHPVLDLVEHGHGRLRDIGDRSLNHIDPWCQDGEWADKLDREFVKCFLAVVLHQQGTREHSRVGHHAHQAVVKLDERVKDMTESTDAVIRAVPDAVAEEHERLVHGLVMRRTAVKALSVAVFL